MFKYNENNKKTIEKINPYYDMSRHDIIEINENAHDRFTVMYYAFGLGYAQGMKAKESELRKQGLLKK